ncbi:unnamed protein product [Coregonus sp. 'balchen']|nr:unnamed protein product [Coregonus sp. 'balchen']
MTASVLLSPLSHLVFLVLMDLSHLDGEFTWLQQAGSKSNVESAASSYFKADKSSLTFHQFTCSHYRFRAFSRRPLSREFQRDIASLPKEYTSNSCDPYQQFIDTYGTHYIHLVDLGGRMKRVTGIRTCLATLNQVSVSQVQTCLSMGLLNVSSGQCSKVSNNQVGSVQRSLTTKWAVFKGYDKGFLSHSTEVTGGDGWMGEVSMTKPDSEGFKKWLNSLKRIPDILSFTVLPLHDLVHDTNVRDNLQTAISQYVIDNGIEKNKTE